RLLFVYRVLGLLGPSPPGRVVDAQLGQWVSEMSQDRWQRPRRPWPARRLADLVAFAPPHRLQAVVNELRGQPAPVTATTVDQVDERATEYVVGCGLGLHRMDALDVGGEQPARPVDVAVLDRLVVGGQDFGVPK